MPPPLDVSAISLTPLTPHNLRAFQSLTSGWSPPHPARGITSHTIGPAAYHRRRLRLAALTGGVLIAVVMLTPLTIVAVALYTNDQARLEGSATGLLYFLIGALALALIGAAISWYQTSGKRRTNAGAEPATQLAFTATTTELSITDGTGSRLSGPWPRWRIADVHSSISHLKSGQLHIFESARLVRLADDGSSAGSVTLDPATLTRGRDFAATVIGMIASNALHPPR